MRRVELQVCEDERRMRLEDFLFRRFGGLSRMYLRERVRLAGCEVNGRHENVGFRLRPNDFIEIELDPTRANAMRPENLPLKIVFEDDELLVVDKPAGMLVHPTHRDKSGTLLNALVFHLNRDSDTGARPGLVHRLDRETSGLMVIAKNLRSHRVLASHFHRKLVQKRYRAIVSGRLDIDEGIIEMPIGRHDELKFWAVRADGKASVTKFWVRKRSDSATLVELEPITGRTNQLRIHCAAVGHPIVGDIARGGPPYSRLCLHAYSLGFRHPGTGIPLKFAIESPPEMRLSQFSEQQQG